MTESLSETMSKPTYQSSLRLESGGTVRVVTRTGGVILFDVVNDDDEPMVAAPTHGEANEMASMLEAAARAAWRA